MYVYIYTTMKGHGAVTFSLSTSGNFLFYGWHIDTILGLILALITTTLAALLSEGLKYVRYLSKKQRGQRKGKPSAKVFLQNMKTRLWQSCLHMLQTGTGLFLMLCSMSYNTWIFISIIVGSSLGYFFLHPIIRIHADKKIERTKPSAVEIALIKNPSTRSVKQ
ncbi:probable low affinity copper uptake protein 2 [Octopus sinensis]|uniref:Copper transport protein n=1 Tax=Octopus sinensis TaxID=2607531 RepID=A0A7E6F0T2_9MOLL|nr:probable low affinity copper uptake protein 2 [Octopus sinensis]